MKGDSSMKSDLQTLRGAGSAAKLWGMSVVQALC